MVEKAGQRLIFLLILLDANNVATFDEPWSRPGDYVLLRALKDLTCISSACPCDVDAANGWNPTDIFAVSYTHLTLPTKRIV